MAINTQVFEALQQCVKNSDSVLDADLNLFCESASVSDKSSVLKQLVYSFGADEDPSLQKIAGIFLYDLVRNEKWKHVLNDTDEARLAIQITDLNFENYNLRNLQARILSHIYLQHYPNCWDHYMEPMVEQLFNGDYDRIDLSLRTLMAFMSLLEDESSMKSFHLFVPKLLPALFSAFTNDQVSAHGREQVLEVFYLCLRTVSWADGIDNELVATCLDDTFNSWMALFLQIIQTNPKAFFDIKKNALKCLNVIFRDFMNYSRECINMILHPSWKLLNFHLPVFTEVLGYNQDIKTLQGEDQQDTEQEDYQRGNESDDDEETYGVEGMTLQLIELLTTLISRQNVQEVVRQGMVPLITTISSYMIIQHKKERQHFGDYHHFIHEKDEDFYKQKSIRNSCLDLVSSLIEVFGDLAVESILFVVEKMCLTSQDSQSPTKKLQSSQQTVQSIDDINIFEFTYSSAHKKHFWKKREVAMFLIGNFAEDISMFRQRNPKYNLRILIEEIISTDFDNCMMKSYLKGRTLQCAAQLVEIMPRDYVELHQAILELSMKFLIEEKLISVKLVATRCLIKFARKVKPELLTEIISDKFELILDQLTHLLDSTSLETIYLPIEAFTQYSRLNEAIVAQMAPKITPKLLKFFRNYHSEGALANELLNLFKIWCDYPSCRDIFINTFIPFIMEIIDHYYQSTPNVDNKDSVLVAQNHDDKPIAQNANESGQKITQIVDSSILQHVIDLLCSLLKKTKDKQSSDFTKIIAVFPKLLEYVLKSEDVFLLLNGTSALRTFIHLGHLEILKIVQPKDILQVANKLLSPLTNEQAAMCLGNYVIQIIHKIEPKIDTALLMNVVWKIYKSRMPSIVQSLVLIFARLIHSHPKQIVEFLSETSIDNRISLKIVLDKWLLQQPLFRGYYTKNVTFSALLKLFTLRDASIESLMVIGYNPSHSNVNSEVNAPFKILSIMLRYLENELSPKKGKRPTQPQSYSDDEGDNNEEEKQGSLMTPGYKLRRDLLGEGERLDTVDGDDDNGDDNDSDEGQNNGGTDRIEVNLDDVEDDDDNESLLNSRNNTGLLAGPQGSLFTIKQGTDRGLADMETGSEVYMSELLAGFDMEDFDEAEEQNEEDLVDLGDSFGNINLKNYIQDTLNEFIKNEKGGAEYMNYCVKQLLHDDQDLAKRYLKLQKQ